MRAAGPRPSVGLTGGQELRASSHILLSTSRCSGGGGRIQRLFLAAGVGNAEGAEGAERWRLRATKLGADLGRRSFRVPQELPHIRELISSRDDSQMLKCLTGAQCYICPARLGTLCSVNARHRSEYANKHFSRTGE